MLATERGAAPTIPNSATFQQSRRITSKTQTVGGLTPDRLDETSMSNYGPAGGMLAKIQGLSKTYEPIDMMKPRVLKLFLMIREQLREERHPLHLITRRFAQSYVNYYSGRISSNMDSILERKEQDFRVDT